MNYKTNWYGAVGLISTLGKNSFAAGETVSNKARDTYQTIRENLIELKMDVALVGEIKVFESLENVSKWSAKKAKSYQTKCEEWESWAEQKFAEAKKQEKLKEDWEWNINPLHTYIQVQKSPYWKARRKFYSLLPKTSCLPSCFSSWRRV